jgi:hypothetical protein
MVVAYARGFFSSRLTPRDLDTGINARCYTEGTTLYIHHHTDCIATKSHLTDSPASALTVAPIPYFFGGFCIEKARETMQTRGQC